MKQDGTYHDNWAPVLKAGSSYMKEHIENEIIDNTLVRLERVQHVFHFFVLEKAINILPSQLSQVIEFGAGTGEIESLLRQANFEGTHFVIDIPPMLFMQSYNLLYSFWPSYLGDTVLALDGRKMILESSINLKSTFYKHLNENELDSSMFMATWSLSEAQIIDRVDFVNSFNKYGIIFIAFKYDFDTINNVDYFLKIAKGLESEYSQCIWEVPLFRKNYYYLAYRKGDQDNKVVCSPITGCNKNTYVYGNCLPTDEVVNFDVDIENQTKSNKTENFSIYNIITVVCLALIFVIICQRLRKRPFSIRLGDNK